MRLRFDVEQVNKRLIASTAENWTLARIARSAGLPTATMYRISDGSASRVDLATVEKLLAFYRSHGLDVSIADLIVETP